MQPNGGMRHLIGVRLPERGGRVTASVEEFTEFTAGAAARLRRTAFLLCGNWHTAEDLTQTTLARMFVSWRRITQAGSGIRVREPDAGERLPGRPAAPAQPGGAHRLAA